MDHACRSLDAILKSDRYDCVAGVPIFDVHDEHDEDGSVRKFDRDKLKKIIDRCNERAKTTGDLSPFGPGHTVTGAKEVDQPDIWGYVHNYRLGEYGPEKKLGILVDFYARKGVSDGKRRFDTARDVLDAYPRRSIEYWVNDDLIDWVALLKRTPQRDLGLTTYDKASNAIVPVKDARRVYAKPGRTNAYAAALRGGKLYYSMESNMDTPVAPPSAGHDEEFHGKFMSSMNRAYPRFGEMHKKYEMDNPATEPEGGNTMVASDDDKDKNPPPDDGQTNGTPPMNDDLERYAKTEGEKALALALKQSKARYDALEARVKASEAREAAERANYAKSDAARRLETLIGEGFDLGNEAEIAEELADMEATPVEKRDYRMNRIRQRYSRIDHNGPPTGRRFLTAPETIAVPAGRGPVRQFSREDGERAQQRANVIAKERNIPLTTAYDIAVSEMKAAK